MRTTPPTRTAGRSPAETHRCTVLVPTPRRSATSLTRSVMRSAGVVVMAATMGGMGYMGNVVRADSARL